MAIIGDLFNPNIQGTTNKRFGQFLMGGKGNNLGSNFGFLENYFKKMIEEGHPLIDEFRQKGLSGINKATDTSLTNLEQGVAGTGLLNTGVMAQGVSNIEAGRSEGVSNLNTGLAELDYQSKTSAVSGLLGLNQFEGSQNLGESQFIRSLLANLFTSGEAQDAQNAQASGFGQILGSLIGAGGTIGAAAISDIRLKTDIEHVGTSEEGLPIIEFKYKGYKNRYRGTIAQEVEKILPSAVQEFGGVKMVDYAQLSMNHERIG